MAGRAVLLFGQSGWRDRTGRGESSTAHVQPAAALALQRSALVQGLINHHFFALGANPPIVKQKIELEARRELTRRSECASTPVSRGYAVARKSRERAQRIESGL